MQLPTEFDAATTPATKHLPTEPAVLLREVLRMKAAGLRPRDIAEVLGLNPSAIESLIDGHEPGSGSV